MSIRGYLGNTFLSIPGAAAHGLSIAGCDYSFMPYTHAGKMIVVCEQQSQNSRTAEVVTVNEARARYAALLAKGATKCEAKRSAYGYNYFGSITFDAAEIARIPDTDMHRAWELSDKTNPPGVTYGANIG